MEDLIFGLIGGFIAWLIKDEAEKNKAKSTETEPTQQPPLQNSGGGGESYALPSK